MTQEQQDLLLKDLCARLPYRVMAQYYDPKDERETWDEVEGIDSSGRVEIGHYILSIENIKPYLFPLSSMTEEQYKKWCDLEGEPLDEILTRNANGEKISTLEHHLLIAKSLTDSVNYCYKNHFDIYGLIPMGLAIDATGLNIY